MKLIVLTPENCEAVVAPLLQLHDTTTERLDKEMTIVQARIVRGWRVDLGCTWGLIGERWSELYPWEGGQILGRALCHRGAILLNENPEDWN